MTKLYFNLFVALANFWIWRILKLNLIIGVALILLSLSLYLINTKYNGKVLVITILLGLFISFQILISGFDKNLTSLNPDQQKQLDLRHGYFSIELGKLFQNKFSQHYYVDFYPPLSIYGSNIFNSLSPNLYFFENHPREREKIDELSLYPSILIIPFLVGFLVLLKNGSNILTAYFLSALLITGFVKQNYLLGPILFFPLINLLIADGFLKIFKRFKK